VRTGVLAIVLGLGLVAAAGSPAAPASDRTLSTHVLTQTLILSADSASVKTASSVAALGKAAAKLGRDARSAKRRVGAEKTSSSAGARCKRMSLATFGQFVSAASSFTAAVSANRRGDRTASTKAFERGKQQLDSALGKLSTAAKLAAALR
jgi:hypothetical protein